MNNRRAKQAALIGIMAALLTVAGIFRIPGFVPGTEFQLSAPVAVAICAVFGFKIYIISGVISSLLSLALGLQNILNVAVAMSFRLAVGAIILLLGSSIVVVIIAGPIGTAAARVVLAGITGSSLPLLLLAAAGGMVFTAVLSYPLCRLMRLASRHSGFTDFVTPTRPIWLRKRRKEENGAVQHKDEGIKERRREEYSYIGSGEDSN